MKFVNKRRLYVTFYTFAEAIATERVCNNEGIKGKLVSIPRKLSAGCGVAWECDPEVKDAVVSLLEKENIEWEEVCEL